MGLDPAMVVHRKAIGPAFTFFIAYGRVSHLVELDKVTVHEREYPLLTAREANLAIRTRLRRKLVVAPDFDAIKPRAPVEEARFSVDKRRRLHELAVFVQLHACTLDQSAIDALDGDFDGDP